MSVLPYQTIKHLCETQDLIVPWSDREVIRGKSFGVSHSGYDIRIKLDTESIMIRPGSFILAVSMERIKIPHDLVAIVHDKSSWARMGLAVQNTVAEAGWEGYLTLELTSASEPVTIYDGDPIAQLIFHRLEEATEKPYEGKYQNQPNVPVPAINEAS